MPAALSVDLIRFGWRRFSTLWVLKLEATVVVSVIFWSCYLFLSYHAIINVHELPITALDRWAGYRPSPWAWIYESIFLLTAITPWLIVSREQLRRYLIGFALLSLASFFVFAFFPVAAPRPASAGPSPFLQFITQIDGPLNAFPSLHAGSLVLNLALIHRLFGRQLHPLGVVALWIWAGLILFATLATKQHYAVDLLAGGLIGWAADWMAWKNYVGGDKAAANTPRNSVATSQAGCR
jgi:membrane-associated phospholipid phosphatase